MADALASARNMSVCSRGKPSDKKFALSPGAGGTPQAWASCMMSRAMGTYMGCLRRLVSSAGVVGRVAGFTMGGSEEPIVARAVTVRLRASTADEAYGHNGDGQEKPNSK